MNERWFYIGLIIGLVIVSFSVCVTVGVNPVDRAQIIKHQAAHYDTVTGKLLWNDTNEEVK